MHGPVDGGWCWGHGVYGVGGGCVERAVTQCDTREPSASRLLRACMSPHATNPRPYLSSGTGTGGVGHDLRDGGEQREEREERHASPTSPTERCHARVFVAPAFWCRVV